MGLFWFQTQDQTVNTPKESTCPASYKYNIRPTRGATLLLAVNIYNIHPLKIK
jgi:hypothetical protein